MLDIDQEFNLCSTAPRQKQFLLKDVLFQSEKKFFSYSSEPLELQLYKIESVEIFLAQKADGGTSAVHKNNITKWEMALGNMDFSPW